MTNKKPKLILKTFYRFLVVFFLAISLFTPVTMAQSNFHPPSILPGDDADLGGYGDLCIGLASDIREGNVSLRQLPCFIKYFSQTLAGIAGSISVVFVMIGGYTYVFAGEEKHEEAKKTIFHALIGLTISLMAWVLVDVVLQIITE